MIKILEHTPEIEELVINWHLTEVCNFRCPYCYSSWKNPNIKGELWRNDIQSRRLLEYIYNFFAPSNLSNPLRASLRWHAVRLSLAGGEPTLLGGRLVDIATEAKKLGFNVSLITNGSRPETISDIAGYLDMLGISIDSANQETNAYIGRACRNRSPISAADIISIVRRVRACRHGIAIKINTVVNALNAEEDMSAFILKARPDRWKIMRMLPTVTEALSVGSGVFQSFVDRHHKLLQLITVEHNSDMTQSYIMVDPYGRFFQNQSQMQGYQYSSQITRIGAEGAFLENKFCPTAFATRYSASSQST